MREVISKVFSKKVLYVLCFMAFHLLDFFRNTLNGDGWSAAANATGLVMFVIILSGHSLRAYLNWGNLLWTIAAAVAAVTPLALDVFRPFGLYDWTYVLAVLNIWWIGMVLRYLITQMVREKKFPVKVKFRGWLWILMTILMTFSVSGRVWPIWFFAMFGAFYLTKYEEQDWKDMLEGMVTGTILSFFALQIYAYGFRPYDEVRYKGAFSNCNMTSLHYLVTYCMVLVKLHLLEMKGAAKGWKIFYLLGAGGILGFMFMTMGRTSWVAAIILTFFYGILVIRRQWQKKWYAVIGRGAALVLSMVLLFPAVFMTVRWLPTVLHHPVWYNGEYNVEKVHSYDPDNSWKYVELDEFLEQVFGRIIGTFETRNINPFVLKVYAAEADSKKITMGGTEEMDMALRVRLGIYEAYLKNSTWIGNPEEAGHFEIESIRYHVWHAQNVWLQIMFSFGIPSGILFVVMTIATIVTAVRILQKNQSAYAIIPFCVSVIFFAFGTMEVVWNIGQVVLLLFFFVQHPQMSETQADALPEQWEEY